MTVRCVAIAGYRSLHELVFAPGPLTVITGGNGVGKSNVYRALELMHAASRGRLAHSLALEGGLPSVVWAGAPTSRGPTRVRLGMHLDAGCFELELGFTPNAGDDPFATDGEVKEERLWVAPPRRKNAPFLTREGGLVRAVDSDGRTRQQQVLEVGESVLGQLEHPRMFDGLWEIQRTLRAFRFYHSFRTDPESPLREARIGTRTPVLASSGEDLAAALCTIEHIGDRGALAQSIEEGLGATLDVEMTAGARFEVGLRVPGLRRRVGARELSDGSLKYLALMAALHSPRPAPLVVFNEPEASLHPNLLAPLAEAIALASRRSSVWVVSHAEPLVRALEARADVTRIELVRDERGATRIVGQTLLNRPVWP